MQRGFPLVGLRCPPAGGGQAVIWYLVDPSPPSDGALFGPLMNKRSLFYRIARCVWFQGTGNVPGVEVRRALGDQTPELALAQPLRVGVVGINRFVEGQGTSSGRT